MSETPKTPKTFAEWWNTQEAIDACNKFTLGSCAFEAGRALGKQEGRAEGIEEAAADLVSAFDAFRLASGKTPPNGLLSFMHNRIHTLKDKDQTNG